MIINCLLVDDEPHALTVLKSHISKIPMLRVVAECNNALKAFELLQENKIDLVFLDIRMPQMTGIDLLKTLSDPPKVIFTTAHAEYALEGYELDIVDYLLKPISLERLMKSVQKVLREFPSSGPNLQSTIAGVPTQEQEKFLYFRVDRKMVKVWLNEIAYIESLKDYVKIVLDEGQLVVKLTMQALEQMLPEKEFIRIHRSFIVSIPKIKSFSQNHVEVLKVELPIGRMYKLEVQKILEGN